MGDNSDGIEQLEPQRKKERIRISKGNNVDEKGKSDEKNDVQDEWIFVVNGLILYKVLRKNLGDFFNSPKQNQQTNESVIKNKNPVDQKFNTLAPCEWTNREKLLFEKY